MARGRVSLSVRRATGWTGAVLALSLVGSIGVRLAYSQDTTPAADVSPLTDTWTGDKLDPKWNVSLLGDAQENESSVKVENGLLLLEVQSGDIWNDNDNGLFIWQPANGDFQVTLEMRSIEKSSEAAKVGIMVRDSLNRFGPNVFQMAMPKGHHMQVRTEVGVNSGPGSGCGTAGGPGCNQWENSGDITKMPTVHVRLTRKGNVFTSEYSSDGGKTWGPNHRGDEIVKDTAEVELPDDVLVGIAVTSNAAGTPTVATLGPITFTQLATRPTGKGLIAATATDDGGTPVADVALEVLKGDEVVGTSYNEDFDYRSNTASFFLDPGTYSIRAAEDDYYEAGAPVPFEVATGKVENLKVKVGALK